MSVDVSKILQGANFLMESAAAVLNPMTIAIIIFSKIKAVLHKTWKRAAPY